MPDKWNTSAISYSGGAVYDRRSSRHYCLKGHCPKGQRGVWRFSARTTH
jgi:hypothetical protein